MPRNLWPDFDLKAGPRGPGRILKEEGAGVSDRTDGIVVFEVETHGGTSELFEHTGYLSVPSLDFRYPLLRVVHGEAPWPEPVTVVSNALSPQSQRVKNEEEFLEVLGRIFQSDHVKNIVRQLVDAAS